MAILFLVLQQHPWPLPDASNSRPRSVRQEPPPYSLELELDWVGGGDYDKEGLEKKAEVLIITWMDVVDGVAGATCSASAYPNNSFLSGDFWWPKKRLERWRITLFFFKKKKKREIRRWAGWKLGSRCGVSTRVWVVSCITATSFTSCFLSSDVGITND